VIRVSLRTRGVDFTVDATVDADAVNETRIKNKIRAADANVTERGILLVFTYPIPNFFPI